MAIIEQNGHGPTKPCGGQNKIGSIVTVDVTSSDLQPAGWCDDADRLAAVGTELQLNPVVCQREVTSTGLNHRQVGAKVAVKVRVSEGLIWAYRKWRCTLRYRACGPAGSQSGESQKTKEPANEPRRRERLTAASRWSEDAVRAIHKHRGYLQYHSLIRRESSGSPRLCFSPMASPSLVHLRVQGRREC